jgi:hypothetical protein
MVIELNDPPAEAVLPDGIEIWHGARLRMSVNRPGCAGLFQGSLGIRGNAFEDNYNRWMNYIDGNPDFDPALWFIS